MICEKYEALSITDRVKFIGELVHCCMSDNTFFDHAQRMIILAESKGLLEGITILPHTELESIE